jgi:hypothetical protein
MAGSPVTTSPVLTPVLVWSVTPQSRSSSAFSGSRAARSPAAARTARRASSSLTTGMPNTATTASPTNFCTRPPWRSRTARSWSNQRAMTTASDSGSRRRPSTPDPARSVNTTVTVLRAGRLAAPADGGWDPQFRQKLALAGFGSPQTGQTVTPSRSRPARATRGCGPARPGRPGRSGRRARPRPGRG